MGNTAKLSAKHQISIPKSVLDHQHWRAGQEFVFLNKGKAVMLVPVADFEDLRGIPKGADVTGFRERKDE